MTVSVTENNTKPANSQPDRPQSPGIPRTTGDDLGGRVRERVEDDVLRGQSNTRRVRVRRQVGDDGEAMPDQPSARRARGRASDDGAALSGEPTARRVRGLATTSLADVAGMLLERLEAQLVDLARQLSAGTYELLVLVGELDVRGGWAALGAQSCEAWLADICDIEVCTARTQVSVANALRTWPALDAAIANGDVSFAKARTLVPHLSNDNVDALVGIAMVTPAGRLGAAIAAWAPLSQNTLLPGCCQKRSSRCSSLTPNANPSMPAHADAHQPADNAEFSMNENPNAPIPDATPPCSSSTTTSTATPTTAQPSLTTFNDCAAPTTEPKNPSTPMARARRHEVVEAAGKLESLISLLTHT